MYRRTERAAQGRAACLALVAALVLAAAAAQPSVAAGKPWSGIGRLATEAEIRAWDIDVRADFTGLPPGAGSVAKGQDIWDAQCASCHGTFGESNEVFPPIVGGTTKDDIGTGRVANLTRSDYPQRTTLMKLAHLSTLWDYIRRAMPWNAPKSLTVDEVYAVTAYILHLGDVLPADFTLSDANIREVQNLLPNRNGLRRWDGLWQVGGRPDVRNSACMKDCLPRPEIRSTLPDHARDSHGNLAAQNRLIGATRGADTTRPASTEPQRLAAAAAAATAIPAASSGSAGDSGRTAAVQAAAAPAATASGSAKAPAELARAAACMSCHGIGDRIVGPAFREIGERYRNDPKGPDMLVAKIRGGGQGAWGPIPMPPQPQVGEQDAASIARWILEGAR